MSELDQTDDIAEPYLSGREIAAAESGAAARLLQRFGAGTVGATQERSLPCKPSVLPRATGEDQDDNAGALDAVADGVGDAAADVAGGLVEGPRQIVGGLLGAGQEFLDTTRSISDWLDENVANIGGIYIGRDGDGNLALRLQGENLELPQVGEPRTATGGAIRGVTQFLTGFIPFLKLAKVAGVPTSVGRAMVAGAAADATVFDPHEIRLSNLIQRYPAMQNPVSEFLAASPEDTEAEGRLKNAAEGLALGALADGLLFSARAVRNMRRRRLQDALARQTALADSGEQAAGEATQRDVLLVGDPEKPLIQVTDRVAEASDALLRRQIPEGAERYTLIGNRQFVHFADGSIDFGQIDDAMASAIGSEPAPIRLSRGNDRFGEIHMELPGRAEQIREAGYRDAAHLVQDVAATFAEIWPGRHRSLMLVKRGSDKAHTVFVTLRRPNGEGFYEVITGGVFREGFPAGSGRKLLWSRERTPRSATGEREPFSAAPDKAGRGDEDAVGQSSQPKIGSRAVNINLARLNAGDDIKQAIADVAQLFGDEIDEARRGVISNEETMRLADDLGMSARDLLGRRQGQAFNAEEALAARRVLASSAEQLVVLARKATTVDASEADVFAFRKAMALHSAIQAQVSGTTAEAGRALQAFRVEAASGAEQSRAIRQLLHESGGEDYSRTMAARIATLSDVGGVSKAARKMNSATTMDMVQEAWINGLLSGPQTHAFNTMSNSLVALWQIPERFVAGQIGRLSGNGGVQVGEATAQAYGLVKGLRQGLKLAAQAMRTGEPSDALGKLEARRLRSITGANLRETAGGRAIRKIAPQALQDGGYAARAVDLLGEAVRIPGRFLMAEDEFFKAVGYQMEVHARAFRQATQEGLEDGPRMAARIKELIDNPSETMRMSAMDAAHYQTFTNELGKTGKAVQKVVGSAPALRFVVPFIRTPTNIIKYTFERTPLAPLSSRIQADIAAGGAARDLALARIATGSSLMLVAADLTMEGHITGGGPADPALKSAMRRQGWQPYSIKIGDAYYSYSRADPMGMFLGISADVAEIVGQVDEAEAAKLVSAISIAFSQNVTSKTWLKGLFEAIEAFDNPDRFGEQFLARFAGSLVPTGLATVERVVDPTLRETRPGAEPGVDPKARASAAANFVRRIVNQARSRIPGYSESLPPRRNMWGDPIVLQGGLGPDIASPIYTSTAVDSPIDREIVALKVPISMPARTIEGVELTAEECDRYVTLAGNGMKNPTTGKGLKDTLDDMARGRGPFAAAYRRASTGPDGGKAFLIRQQVQAFRAMAQAQLKREFPDLTAAIIAQATARADARRPQ